MSTFESNLSALKNEKMREEIKKVEESFSYEVFMRSSSDLISLNLVNTKSFIPLYPQNPESDISQRIAELASYEKYPYLYMFGLGNGFLLKHLFQNQDLKRIVVFEPDIQILYAVLNVVDFTKELEEQRLIVLIPQELSYLEATELFNDDTIKRFAKSYELLINTSFYEQFTEIMVQTNKLLIDALYHNIELVGNDIKDSLIGMKHHFANLPFMLKTPPFLELIQKAHTSKTAVLVATGPSLTKQLPLLKQIAPYVTIFAVDASFPVLSKNEIKPDVVVSMERVSLSSEFFKQTPKEAYEDVIFALSSLQHSEVVNSIKGGTVQMSMRPFGYMQQSGATPWGYAGLGFSAANMAFEIIFYSQFDTCILIGQDLAFGEDGLSHAKGHALGEDDVKFKTTDSYVTRYGGEGEIKTSAIWKMFLRCFEKDIQNTKWKMKTINATEGGARISAAIEMPFKEAVATFVDQSQQKEKIVLTPLNKTKLKIVTKEVSKNIQKMRNFLEKQKKDISFLLTKITQFAQKQRDFDEAEKLYKEIMVFRKRLQEEYFQDVIWFVGKSMLFGKELELAKLEVEFCKEKQNKVVVELILIYQEWFYGLLGCIEALEMTMDGKEISF